MNLYSHIKENYTIDDKDFLLQDDGDGCYLKKWDSELTPPIALGEIWVDDGFPSKEEYNAPILFEIKIIEAKQARPLREAFSADEAIREQAMIYIKQYDDEIIKLRGQLL